MAEKSVVESKSDAKAEDEVLNDLPGGMAPLKTIHDSTAQELLDLAEQLVKDAQKRFGPRSSKPRLKQVEKLFRDHAGHEPKVEAELDRSMRGLGSIEKLAVLDQSYDQTMAKAFNTFDKISIDSGSKVQDSCDTWTMAVRIYESETRAAGAIFKAAIDKAEKEAAIVRPDPSPKEIEQIAYYTKSSAIADGLVVYEKSMDKTTAKLSIAFGQLIQGLFAGFTKVAVGEASLISDSQRASLDFWTKLHTELSKART